MYWDVTFVQPKDYLQLTVHFADGLRGEVHFSPSHLTGVFKLLEDKNFFNKVYVNHGAVTWPRELDLAPDTMYNEIKKNGRWLLE